MRDGSGFDKTEYYLKTDNGLWLKGWVDLASGCIRVAHQNRLVFTRNRSVSMLSASGDPLQTLSMSNTELPEEWTVCGELSLDTKSFSKFLHLSYQNGYDGALLHQRIIVHSVRLGAMGWGDSLGEPLSWFSDPLSRSWLVKDKYRVDVSGGVFSGLDGLIFEPSIDDYDARKSVDKTVTCAFLYDGRSVTVEAPIFDLVYFCSPMVDSV